MINVIVYIGLYLSYIHTAVCIEGANDTCQTYVNESTCILNEVTELNVNQTNPCQFSCYRNTTEDWTLTQRLFLTQRTLTNSRNIFAIVQSDHFIKSYTIPISLEDGGNFFTSLSEIVCPSEGRIFFSITTNSDENVLIQFYIREVAFLLPDSGVIVKSSPVSPWAKVYKWTYGVPSVYISVQSKTPADAKICAILYLQNAKCPLATSYGAMQDGGGKYQTFRQFGGTTAYQSDFPDGIFIVILPLPNNHLCNTLTEDRNVTKRKKTVFIQALEQSSHNFSWISYIGSFTIFTAIIGAGLFTIKRRTYKHFAALLEPHGALTLGDSGLREPFAFQRMLQVLQLFSPTNLYTAHEQNLERQNVIAPGISVLEESQESQDDLLLAVPMQEEPPAEPVEVGKLLPIKMMPFVPVTNLLNPSAVAWWKSESTYVEMRPSSKLSEVGFSRNLLITAAFTTISVASTLKYFMQQSQNKLDTCYFNRKCLVTVGPFEDFSRVFTNFAYVVAAVAIKHVISYHEQLTIATANSMGRNDIGVCRQYSLFNVLAYELILQAYMSAMFHMCPNSVTIKFDIIFIYALTITFIGCIWSLRHSDFNQFTYSTFGLISSALMVAELQDCLPYWVFWLIVGLLHMYMVLSISFLLTKFGTFSFNPKNVLRLYTKWSTVMSEVRRLDLQADTARIPTAIRIAIGILINVVVLADGVYSSHEIYAYIFGVCLINLSYYLVHYMITKRFLAHERGASHGWVSLSVATVLLIPAGVFLHMSNVDYNASPADSLLGNSFCLLTVFSAHDLWHLTSALIAFALFSGILTLDDDLALQPSSEIAVF